MRRPLILTSVLIAACAASGAAMAQSTAPTTGSGLRYLSWPGKAASAPLRQSAPRPTPVAAVANTSGAVLPLARLDAPAPSATPPSAPRRGLTPASDWISPATTAPQAYFTPRAPAAAPAIPAAPPLARVETPAPRPVPAETAVQTPAPPPTPVLAAAPPAPVEAAPAEPALDPMAPRRDAPIFRLQRQSAEVEPPVQAQPEPAPAQTQTQAQAQPQSQPAQPQPQLQAALAPVQGPRFYSVHRQAGRQPDPISTPQPIYLDALPVELTQTPTSTDLAQPDGPPALLRSSDGTVRAMPQTQADDLP